MICHSSVVAKGDVFLFPVFAESVGGLFVELALFHRDGATRAERPCSVGAAAVAVRFATRSTPASSRGVAFTIHLLFAGSEQVGPPSVFPKKGSGMVNNEFFLALTFSQLALSNAQY